MTLKSIWSKNDRPAWSVSYPSPFSSFSLYGIFRRLLILPRQAWWVELALVEYLELVLFRENARSLIWWPKVSLSSCSIQFLIKMPFIDLCIDQSSLVFRFVLYGRH